MVSERYRRELASSGLRASQVLVLITCGTQFYLLPFVSKHSSDSSKLSLWSVTSLNGKVSCNPPTPGWEGTNVLGDHLRSVFDVLEFTSPLKVVPRWEYNILEFSSCLTLYDEWYLFSQLADNFRS